MAVSIEPEYEIPPHVLYRGVDEQMVLLDLDREEYYGLSEVGATIVRTITTLPFDQAFAEIRTMYAVDDATLRSDVTELVESLLGAGLLVRRPAT